MCLSKVKYLQILSNKALSDNSTITNSVDRKFYSVSYYTTPNSFSSNDLYIFVSSFLFPRKTLYVHLEREIMHLLDDSPSSSNMLLHSYYHKNHKLLMKYKFQQQDYEDKLIYIPNTPHAAVYLMYKKGTKLYNKNKCLLMGYGAYASDFESDYKSKNGGAMYFASLMDRGFIIALAYIRGGQFGGYDFHVKGRMKQRNNVYNDFIKISKFLINKNITETSRFAIYGRSAGGLLIGNVINMEPELYKLAILGVPFVMPYNVMIDKRNPLAFESHYEFGDPFNKSQIDIIKKESPYLQVNKDKLYPNIFIFSNIYDSLTPYSESYNYYHKLKECDVFKENKRDLIYFLNDKYGHKQSSKTRESKREFARYFTIVTKYIQ
jgi:oligopeptidase B